MTSVNTVLGPIDSKDLGFTLMHEHLVVGSTGFIRDFPELFGPNFKQRVIDALKQAKIGGVSTIVDATTRDLGRDVEFMAEVSRASGVNIIAVTGYWTDIPRYLTGVSADHLADIFVREIEQGISGTNIKAGLLKEASDSQGVTEKEEVILRAVARAHKLTGTPIMLHSCAPLQVGRRQLAVLKEEGVDLRRVKMDHCLETADVEYLSWLLEQGCYLGLERYPGRVGTPQMRFKTIRTLLDAGYADRLCPSHDWIPVEVAEAIYRMFGLTPEDRQRANPDGFLAWSNVMIPQLLTSGVPENILKTLGIVAPRHFFEGV